MNYEILLDNKYMKTIRLSYGILIHIYKCETEADMHSYIKNTRKDLKKIDDNFYKLNVEIKDTWRNKTYPIGTICRKEKCCYFPIVQVYEDQDDWFWEIKTTGSAFSGNTEDFITMIDTVKDIINNEEYYTL